MKSLLESNPPKSRFLVRGLAAEGGGGLSRRRPFAFASIGREVVADPKVRGRNCAGRERVILYLPKPPRKR